MTAAWLILAIAAAAVVFLLVRGRWWPWGPCRWCTRKGRGKAGRGVGSGGGAWNRCGHCGGKGERIRPLALSGRGTGRRPGNSSATGASDERRAFISAGQRPDRAGSGDDRGAVLCGAGCGYWSRTRRGPGRVPRSCRRASRTGAGDEQGKRHAESWLAGGVQSAGGGVGGDGGGAVPVRRVVPGVASGQRACVAGGHGGGVRLRRGVVVAAVAGAWLAVLWVAHRHRNPELLVRRPASSFAPSDEAVPQAVSPAVQPAAIEAPRVYFTDAQFAALMEQQVAVTQLPRDDQPRRPG